MPEEYSCALFLFWGVVVVGWKRERGGEGGKEMAMAEREVALGFFSVPPFGFALVVFIKDGERGRPNGLSRRLV